MVILILLSKNNFTPIVCRLLLLIIMWLRFAPHLTSLQWGEVYVLRLAYVCIIDFRKTFSPYRGEKVFLNSCFGLSRKNKVCD